MRVRCKRVWFGAAPVYDKMMRVSKSDPTVTAELNGTIITVPKNTVKF